MEVLMISNGIFEYDGRLRELIKVSKKIGSVTIVSRSTVDFNSTSEHFGVNHKGKLSYLRFILKAIKIALKMKRIDILFVDNRKAIIPALLINILKRPKIIIQDVRELYLKHEINHFTGKVGCYFEKVLLKNSNIVISANKYRSEIMKSYFNLVELPLVFENIRDLEVINNDSAKSFLLKNQKLLSKNTIKIISTSGCDIKRTNDRLVKAMSILGDEFELFLVGGCSQKDYSQVIAIIESAKIQNVNFIDRLEQSELRALISKCHIGVVNYSKEDTNNQLCASGKVYEFIFAELPIISTENSPLIELVHKNKLGISDDEYFDGILEIKNNYDFYKKNVIKYSKKIDSTINNQKLVNEINKILYL